MNHNFVLSVGCGEVRANQDRCRGRVMPLKNENGLAVPSTCSPLNINLDSDRKHRGDSDDSF